MGSTTYDDKRWNNDDQGARDATSPTQVLRRVMSEAISAHPYATAAGLYADAGWAGVLPLPERDKWPPPAGYTGHGGGYPETGQITRWVHDSGQSNIGLRLPEDVIGIDVDDYDNKHGGDTFRAMTEKNGRLPATWTSTSRHDGISGIRLYRLPEPMLLNDKPGPGIEIIQHHHRYVVAWPSVHPEGREYMWITPDGERVASTPRPEDLPLLPAKWLTALQAPKARNISIVLPDSPRQTDGEWTRAVEAAFGRAMAELPGGRHDAALHGCAGLIRLETLGYPGATDALRRLETAFLNSVSTDGTRSDRTAASEWERMVQGAQEMIRATPSIIRPYAELVGGHPSGSGEQPQNSNKDNLPPAPETTLEWEPPVPLSTLGARLPPFPIHVFPDWISQQIMGVAGELQVPVDLPAMLALGALSTIAAGHVKVVVAGTWREPVNLYLVTAMPPGSGKSPASKVMLRPVQEYETELIEAARPLVARHEQEQRIREKAMKRAEDIGNKADALQFLEDIEKAKPVTIPQLTVDDATPEALVTMLAENQGRAAILSTEGGLFDIMASSRYNDSTAANFQVYLKGFSGDWHKDRRVGRGASNIDEVTLTISLTVQPAVIAKLSAKPELAGVGLTARFMYAIPSDLVGWRDFVGAQAVPPAVADTYRLNMLGLARQLGAQNTPLMLQLTAEAAALYLQWHQDMEPRRRNRGDLKVVAEWSEKLRSCVVRVAGLLHLADGNGQSDISVDTLKRSIEVADYWLEHALVVHDLWSGMGASPVAQRILDWLSEEGRTEFTARECYRELKLQVDPCKVALELLGSLGWIAQTTGEFGRGGKPSPRYAVHPIVTLRDTAGHSPDFRDYATERTCVTAVSRSVTDRPVFGDDDETAGTSLDSSLEDIESDEGSTKCPSVTSAYRDTSESLSLSFFTDENEREKARMPNTRDTGTQPLEPCPVCAEIHPPDMCPAQL